MLSLQQLPQPSCVAYTLVCVGVRAFIPAYNSIMQPLLPAKIARSFIRRGHNARYEDFQLKLCNIGIHCCHRDCYRRFNSHLYPVTCHKRVYICGMCFCSFRLYQTSAATAARSSSWAKIAEKLLHQFSYSNNNTNDNNCDCLHFNFFQTYVRIVFACSALISPACSFVAAALHSLIPSLVSCRVCLAVQLLSLLDAVRIVQCVFVFCLAVSFLAFRPNFMKYLCNVISPSAETVHPRRA